MRSWPSQVISLSSITVWLLPPTSPKRFTTGARSYLRCKGGRSTKRTRKSRRSSLALGRRLISLRCQMWGLLHAVDPYAFSMISSICVLFTTKLQTLNTPHNQWGESVMKTKSLEEPKSRMRHCFWHRYACCLSFTSMESRVPGGAVRLSDSSRTSGAYDTEPLA